MSARERAARCHGAAAQRYADARNASAAFRWRARCRRTLPLQWRVTRCACGGAAPRAARMFDCCATAPLAAAHA
jgi:hypothetical protein